MKAFIITIMICAMAYSCVDTVQTKIIRPARTLRQKREELLNATDVAGGK